MSRNTGSLLFWSPRVLSIAFAVFLSVFALDVFKEGLGLWQTAIALAMHLIPTAIFLVALILAWRWEWVGGVFYPALAAVYAVWSLPRHPAWFLAIGAPLLVMAGLFVMGWFKRSELRAAH